MDPAPDTRYGGLHLRLAAGAIDLLLSQTLYFLLIIVHAMWSGLLDISRIGRPIAPWISAVVTWAYFVGFESSSRCATPGKMLLRLVVVDARGRRISFLRASVRFLGKLVSAATVVGVLAIPFNRRRRGLHDVLAGTLVVEGRTAATAAAEAERPSRASLTAWRRLAWPLAGALVLLLLATWQLSAWDRERAAQSACLEALQLDLAKAKAAQNKLEQFRAEVRRLESGLEEVSRMLPARLDVDGFRTALVEELGRRGIRVQVLEVRNFRRSRLFRAEIRVELAGDAAAIAAALNGSCCGGRVTTWKGSFTDERVRGALSIYATPAPVEALPDCAPPRNDVWMWPFSGKAKALALEIARERTQLAGLSSVCEEVRRYESMKADLERRIEFVNRLKGPPGEGGEPEPEVPIGGDQGAVRS